MRLPVLLHKSRFEHDASTLGALRRRGIQVWAVIGWAALALLLIADMALGTGISVPLLLIGLAVNLGPTMMALHGRNDPEARMLVGALAAVIPAMLVAVLRGHAWQMDAHMYFFVGMAGLVVLADWRPLAIATLLTAIHHAMFEWLAPHWVFTGSGNFGRVIFHAVAVVLQFIALSVLTRRLESMVEAQDAALATSNAHAATAEAERLRALAAMEQARDAEAQAARERRARDEAMKRAASARRDELLALADRFERSVTGVVKAIGDASDRLERSASRLDETIAGADDAAGEVAAGASLASAEITEVALSIHDLSHSVRAIATTAGRQTELTGQASGEARRSVQTIALLEERTTMIEGLVGDIRKIANQTNLLALNATIEAARAGEAGRGFTIVANEVKTLAANSRLATDRIGELLVGIRDGVVETSANLRTVSSVIGEVAVAADGIAHAVERQEETARHVGAGTDRAVETSASIERRVAQVATAAGVVAGLSTQVKSSAGELSRSARELRASTDLFVSYLQRDDPLAA